MTDTWDPSFLYHKHIIDNMSETNYGIFAYVLLVIFIFLQILFLFYAYVNRVNRERDKNNLVFPIIDHIYTMLKWTYGIYYFILFTLIFFLLVDYIFGPSLIVFILIIAVPCLCLGVLDTFIQVFEFFSTIMAIQKFLLYFFPSSQKYIILSKANMELFINYAYCFFIVKEAVGSFTYGYRATTVIKVDENSLDGTEIFALILFFSMDVIFFVSAFLYIPILISVQKHSHLRSFQEAKPQIYIFWQTMTVVVVKMTYSTLCLCFLLDKVIDMVIEVRLWDILFVPIIIQISYLTCNKRNVVTLFAWFKGWKLIKELMKAEVTTRVSPDPSRHRI